MKKITFGLIILLAALLLVAGQVFGEGDRKTSSYAGIVHEVNVEKKTIVAGKEDRNIAMLFDASKATFTNATGLEDLQRGDKVVIEYDAIRGHTFAVTVTREQ